MKIVKMQQRTTLLATSTQLDVTYTEEDWNS